MKIYSYHISVFCKETKIPEFSVHIFFSPFLFQEQRKGERGDVPGFSHKSADVCGLELS